MPIILLRWITIIAIVTIFCTTVLKGQIYTVGDTVDNFSTSICANDSGNWEYNIDGLHKVTWLNIFTSWWPSCQAEAPLTENIWQVYQGQPIVVIAAGDDWHQPYSCEDWASTFGLSYPILDDDNGYIYGLFGTGYIPHNVIIDHMGIVLYSTAGFNQSAIISVINSALENMDSDNDGVYNGMDNCPDVYNPYQEDEDNDGTGDVCDNCNNEIFSLGNLNGDDAINIIDVLMLIDVVLGINGNECMYNASDINGDDYVNVLDVLGLVQEILGGNRQQAIQFLEGALHPEEFKRLTKQLIFLNAPEKLTVWPNPSNEYMTISGYGFVSIYNIRGKLIKELYLTERYHWDTRKLSSGIYYLINNGETVTVTLLKWLNVYYVQH